MAEADNGEAVSWLIMAETYWGPGLVIPTHLIEPLVAWGDEQNEPNYDRRIGRWFRERETPVYATWPSLVEHRDTPSLVKGRVGGRHAHRFIGEDVSALGLDWSLGAVTVPDPRGVPRPTPRARARTMIAEHTAKERPDMEIGDTVQIEGELTDLTDKVATIKIGALGGSFHVIQIEPTRLVKPTPDRSVFFLARPIGAPNAVPGRQYTYRDEAIKYLRSRGGGTLTAKDEATGEVVMVVQIDRRGQVA